MFDPCIYLIANESYDYEAALEADIESGNKQMKDVEEIANKINTAAKLRASGKDEEASKLLEEIDMQSEEAKEALKKCKNKYTRKAILWGLAGLLGIAGTIFSIEYFGNKDIAKMKKQTDDCLAKMKRMTSGKSGNPYVDVAVNGAANYLQK